MDSSQGVTDELYRKEKEFIKSLASQFNLSPNGPRGSTVMYADNPYTIANFVEQNFNSRVDSAPLLNKPRRMDRALEHAARMLSSRGGRKIVILLTAGRQTQGGKPLGEAIGPLRQMGAQTFVVAIGRDPDSRELSPLVDKSKDVFQVPSPENLPARSRVIAKRIREKPGE